MVISIIKMDAFELESNNSLISDFTMNSNETIALTENESKHSFINEDRVKENLNRLFRYERKFKGDVAREDSIEFNIGMTVEEFVDKYRGIYNIYKVAGHENGFVIFDTRTAEGIIHKHGDKLDVCELVLNNIGPLPMYFDIDIDLTKDTPSSNKKKYLMVIIQRIQRVLISKYDIEDKVKYTVFDSSRKDKWSWHIIMHMNVDITILKELLLLYNRDDSKLPSNVDVKVKYIDNAVYGNKRYFRCVGSSKCKNFEIVPGSIKKAICGKEFKYIMASNDFPTAHLKPEYQSEVDKVTHYALPMSDSELSFISDTNSKSGCNSQLELDIVNNIINKNTHIFKSYWRVRDIIVNDDKTCVYVALDKAVKDPVWCCIHNRYHDNENFYGIVFSSLSFKLDECYLTCRRSESECITKSICFHSSKYTWRDYIVIEKVRPIMVDSEFMVTEYNDMRVLDDDYYSNIVETDELDGVRLKFIKAPMGYGKTAMIHKRMMQHDTILYISFRVLLAEQFRSSLIESGYNVVYYKEVRDWSHLKFQSKSKNVVIIQYESLHKLALAVDMWKYDCVVVDECISLIDNMVSGLTHKCVHNMEFYDCVIKSTKQLYLVDANINPQFIDNILELYGDQDHNISYHKYDKPIKKCIITQADIKPTLSYIMKPEFKCIAISMCSCTLSKKVYNHILENNLSDRTILINGDDLLDIKGKPLFYTKSNIANINEVLKGYKSTYGGYILIYNSSMLAGVSITVPFDVAITYVDGQILNTHHYTQLSGRIRDAKSYIFVLNRYSYKTSQLIFDSVRCKNFYNSVGKHNSILDSYFTLARETHLEYSNINTLYALLCYNGFEIEFDNTLFDNCDSDIKLTKYDTRYDINLKTMGTLILDDGRIGSYALRNYFTKYERVIAEHIKNDDVLIEDNEKLFAFISEIRLIHDMGPDVELLLNRLYDQNTKTQYNYKTDISRIDPEEYQSVLKNDNIIRTIFDTVQPHFIVSSSDKSLFEALNKNEYTTGLFTTRNLVSWLKRNLGSKYVVQLKRSGNKRSYKIDAEAYLRDIDVESKEEYPKWDSKFDFNMSTTAQDNIIKYMEKCKVDYGFETIIELDMARHIVAILVDELRKTEDGKKHDIEAIKFNCSPKVRDQIIIEYNRPI